MINEIGLKQKQSALWKITILNLERKMFCAKNPLKNLLENPGATLNIWGEPCFFSYASICDCFCYQIFDLEKHTESVHDNYKLEKWSICDSNCSLKGNLKVHIGSVHENKKSYMWNLQSYFF